MNFFFFYQATFFFSFLFVYFYLCFEFLASLPLLLRLYSPPSQFLPQSTQRIIFVQLVRSSFLSLLCRSLKNSSTWQDDVIVKTRIIIILVLYLFNLLNVLNSSLLRLKIMRLWWIDLENRPFVKYTSVQLYLSNIQRDFKQNIFYQENISQVTDL